MNKYLQQLSKPSTAPIPISMKFKMLNIPIYNGTWDPRDHIMVYTTRIKRNNLTKEEIGSVLVKISGETLKREL